MENKKKETIEKIKENIEKYNKKEFNVYFFVLDTKGNPSSSLEYIYQTALVLLNSGYNVSILHNEKEFIGVGDWLGEKYANIKHYNIEKDNVEISPCDFLFIPEIFANVMLQSKNLPCKKIAIVQNYGHICEFMPVSHTFESVGVFDAIVTTDYQGEKVKEFFPGVTTHTVHPSIKPFFRNDTSNKKLIINICSKEVSEMNQIIKPFYWENPLYKWVSFRDLRGLKQEYFADSLRDGAITICDDESTNFGYTILEALKSGSIVMAKIPNHPSEWMLDEKGNLIDSVIWYNNVDDVPQMLCSLVRSWTLDAIPEDLYESMSKCNNLYLENEQEKEILNTYEGLFNKRKTEFEEVLRDVENNSIKINEDNE